MFKEEIENIIIVEGNQEIDFQAHHWAVEVLSVNESEIEYIHPLTEQVQVHPCEVHGGAAIIFA